ncbi:ATP-binding cassette domain-containing protein [Microbacterium schleiferi]|uniref:ATP-binding cassette domain-containing protein n=1 Tax=Microbacterium schleiferi TaxID=69362 RepID=UPI001D17AFA5|nr:sugar ABC transporter ATP-binding protein [Microbacterium schleiferi]MCC4269076.1 sugar ABC transporter ATP-binding protein [Microbacterium schleiferi]
MNTPTRLEFLDTTVNFGATRALSALSFSIGAGEIVGLLGHNGAGKSTVLNVATGAVPLTSGRIMLDGQELPQPLTPTAASGLGLAVIHQEPALASNLSVLDNLLLMKKVGGGKRHRRAAAEGALRRVDPVQSITLEQPVSSLSLGERQMVDLARTSLSGELRVLFLDEPTAALGDRETKALHGLVRDAAARGTTVIYVSHRLPDILDVCDRIIVLRAGALVADQRTADMTTRSLAHALAPDLEDEVTFVTEPGSTVLEVGSGRQQFGFRGGEIVGLFGMAGGPQFRLLDALFGLGDPVDARMNGGAYRPKDPNDAIAKGVHLVPRDREMDGLIPALSGYDNVALPWLSRRRNRGDSLAESYRLARRTLHIIGPGGHAPIAEFSGGNRQKHLLARWMFPVAPAVLLLSQPTQGVDISAKRDIREAVRRLASAGCAVLVASAETDEIATLCGRAYVLGGRGSRELPLTADFDSRLLATLLDLSDTQSAYAPLEALLQKS